MAFAANQVHVGQLGKNAGDGFSGLGGVGGEFTLRAKINGVTAPMVIDTGATSVVLTWETAKAIGLPLEMLEYDVDLETAGGHTKAARLTLARLAVGHLVEKSVPALDPKSE